jgi:glycosyltransferase involved in cell wall biosynthesis
METSPLKISIVIPTRNGAPYLRYCIETCLASDDQNLEVIVSDNCSSDNTREVVASFSDNRLHYYNTGASLSMRQNYEFVLPKATGDYIVYIGDDDGFSKNTGLMLLTGGISLTNGRINR